MILSYSFLLSKVFTVNDESKYLLLFGVPRINLDKEVVSLCLKYGPLEEVRQVKDYPQEDKFSTIYMVKFRYFLNAIYAKKKLDDRSFMGSCLHVCYAPELETVDETRYKLIERKNMVQRKCVKLSSMNKKKISKADDHLRQQKSLAKELQEDHDHDLPDCFASYTPTTSTMNPKDFLVRQSMIYAWEKDTKEVKEGESMNIDNNQTAGPSKQTQDNCDTSDHQNTSANTSNIAISNLRDVDRDNLTNHHRKRPRINWRSNNK